MEDDWLSTQELFTKARALAKLEHCACAAALEQCTCAAALLLTSAREHSCSCWKALQTCLSLATVRVAEGRDLARRLAHASVDAWLVAGTHAQAI